MARTKNEVLTIRATAEIKALLLDDAKAQSLALPDPNQTGRKDATQPR
ncbi:hypothetical protein [Thiobaca trueperi]|uniref:Uncharacterized protein n=1 Tax=Thiobaca trueperi TaxID=127458 RepID=A0A4R3N4S6_9GAMM|nr:hypothetical protein [Thiobaca trueperi]TCT22103.1 hypothetical protein EDC35_103201 [Thiobaca trueperi]